MGRTRTRRWIAVALAAGVLVGAGAAVLVPRQPVRLDPVAEAELVGHGSQRPHPSVPSGRVGGPTAVQRHVLATVPGAHASGGTVVVPAVLVGDSAHEVVRRRQLARGVLPLGVHAYSQPWDWTDLDPVAALWHPGPGPVVADLGAAYLGCRTDTDEGDGCALVTLVRDGRGRWRLVERWEARWGGVEQWPYGPSGALQVRVYADLAAARPAYLVAGAARGEAGTVQLRTTTGAVETVPGESRVLRRSWWVFRAQLPDPPSSVTALDLRGTVLATWGTDRPGQDQDG